MYKPVLRRECIFGKVGRMKPDLVRDCIRVIVDHIIPNTHNEVEMMEADLTHSKDLKAN